MAPGLSRVSNITWCADTAAAASVAVALGASVERDGPVATVRGWNAPQSGAAAGTGSGVAAGTRTRAVTGSAGTIEASCGESGLCLRMFSSIAALSPRPITLRGEGSLARRPVGMVEAPLRALGAEASTDGGLPPVRVRGPLRGGAVEVDGRESSQFLTGLLLALPMTGADSVVRVNGLASRGYIDLTMAVAAAFGAGIERDEAYTEFRVRGDRPYRAAGYETEGDWSGAAFLLVAGAIAGGQGGLSVGGLSESSAQPDRSIVRALELAGARLEPIAGGYRVAPGALRAFSFDATDCPDLFPPLVALASRCPGVTALMGASRLRSKESDRAAALSEEFGKLGLGIVVDGDTMTVRGMAEGERIAGGRVSSRGDHRIAMAAAVAALAGAGPVLIDGAECVAKSYPDFFEALDSIRLRR